MPSPCTAMSDKEVYLAVSALAAACPGVIKRSCPFKRLRDLGGAVRQAELLSMPAAQRRNYLAVHYRCFRRALPEAF